MLYYTKLKFEITHNGHEMHVMCIDQASESPFLIWGFLLNYSFAEFDCWCRLNPVSVFMSVIMSCVWYEWAQSKCNAQKLQEEKASKNTKTRWESHFKLEQGLKACWDRSEGLMEEQLFEDKTPGAQLSSHSTKEEKRSTICSCHKEND